MKAAYCICAMSMGRRCKNDSLCRNNQPPCDVAITYAKDAAAASVVVKAIELSGGKAVAIQADAADAKAVTGAIERPSRLWADWMCL